VTKSGKYKLAIIIFIGVVIFTLLIFGAFFIWRDKLLLYGLEKIEAKAKKRYNVNLNIESATFEGFKSISISTITLVPQNEDTLLKVDKVYTDINILPLFKGQISFKELAVYNALCTPTSQNGRTNYSFLFHSETKDDKEGGERNYGKTLNLLIDKVFSMVPDNIKFENLRLNFIKDNYKLDVAMPSLDFKGDEIYSEIILNTGDTSEKWIAKGNINKSQERFKGKLYAASGKLTIPYVQNKWNLKVQMDTLSFSLFEKDYDDDLLKVRGFFSVRNFLFHHPKVDSNDIRISNGGFNFDLLAGNDMLSFDSSSTAIMNDLKFKVFTYYSKKDSAEYKFKLVSEKTDAQKFFDALPSGLFDSFKGMKVKGNIFLTSEFHLDMKNVDSVYFHTTFKDEGFKIIEMGETDFSKLSKPFRYTAYEKGRAVKSFTVGPENPDFVPLEEISEYLKRCVLISEDESFFSHQGFREKAFRKAIADNIKANKFKRGGSTLSMQLVKNVFLSRSKTVARKLEEALIVWLIERQRLASKDRMYEVYLNIIEWGPMVYGISDAAEFYFNKHPAQLTIEESIFLASIVPKPKSFKYSFDQTGQLRSHLAGYYRKLGAILLKRGVISEEEYANLTPTVNIAGRASEFIVKKEVVPDSLNLEETYEPLF
jgi:hypothetical protein